MGIEWGSFMVGFWVGFLLGAIIFCIILFKKDKGLTK